MGRMTIDQLKQKYGTEGVRVMSNLYWNTRENGDDPNWDMIDAMGEMLRDVGECLTEEVT